MKNYYVLIAADFQDSKNYVSVLQHAGFNVINLRKDSSFPYPAMSSLLNLEYDILLLPGGGDFSSVLYTSEQYGCGYLSPHISTQSKRGACPPCTCSSSEREAHPSCLSSKHENRYASPYASLQPQHTTSEISLQEAALDMVQYALLASALQAHKPVVGICKGMQLINAFFGGTLIEDLPDNTHQIDVSGQLPIDSIHRIHTISPDTFHAQFNKRPAYELQDSIYRILAPFEQVNSAHHQGIGQLGKDLFAIQYASDHLPETILHTTLPVIGFQWHPERFSAMTAETMREIMLTLLQF